MCISQQTREQHILLSKHLLLTLGLALSLGQCYLIYLEHVKEHQHICSMQVLTGLTGVMTCSLVSKSIHIMLHATLICQSLTMTAESLHEWKYVRGRIDSIEAIKMDRWKSGCRLTAHMRTCLRRDQRNHQSTDHCFSILPMNHTN